MGLGKIAIGLIATGVTVVAVGGIVGGVVASRSADASNPSSGNGDGSDSDQGTETGSSNLHTVTAEELTAALNKITVENIVLTPIKTNEDNVVRTEVTRKSLVESTNQTAVNINSVFAFNIGDYSITLNNQDIFPERIKVEVSVEQNSAKNLVDLNNGKLTLVIKAMFNDQVSSTRNLEVNTFKKPATALINLFKDQQNNGFTLDVTSDLSSAVNVFTIEELNQKVQAPVTEVEEEEEEREEAAAEVAMVQMPIPSVLTDLYRKSLSTGPEGLMKNTLNIEGNVKLEKIEKTGMGNDAKTYFYLTSADDSFLKLTAKTNGEMSETSEVLVKQIKLNNLAVSSISVVPTGNDEAASTAFTKTLKETWKTTHDSSPMPSDSLTVTVPKSGSSGTSVTVNANAYTITKNSTEDAQKPTTASLLVSFGSGTSAKIYNTSEQSQSDELKNAGFSFGVYSKNLTHTIMKFKESNVGMESNMLQTYFTATSNKTPVNKPAVVTAAEMKQPGEFYLYRLTSTASPTTFPLGKNEPVTTETREVRDSGPVPAMNNDENWVVFANYSYPNLKQNMVLTPHSISLINVKTPIHEQ